MSYRTDLTERLIIIPFKLAGRPYSRQELAQEFGVDPKTVSHDIDGLTHFYPIESEHEGREVFYRFSDGYRYSMPSFAPEELATLLLAQESIAAVGLTASGTPYAAYADRLLKKVRDSLPLSIRTRMDALAAVYGSAAVPAKNFAPHTTTIDRLTTAALERRRVEMRYHALNTGLIEDRIVEPYAVYFDPDGATLKLIAYDHHHREIRAFSVDRIRTLRVTEQRFKRPPGFDLRAYLTENCFNGIHGTPVTVRLRARGVTARIFAERNFHPSQRILEETPPSATHTETTTIEMRVAGGRGLIRFILSWMPEIEVLSPPAVRLEVAAALREGLDRLDAAIG